MTLGHDRSAQAAQRQDMSEARRLRNVADIATALLAETRREWNAVAAALGPLGTGRLLALQRELAALGP